MCVCARLKRANSFSTVCDVQNSYAYLVILIKAALMWMFVYIMHNYNKVELCLYANPLHTTHLKDHINTPIGVTWLSKLKIIYILHKSIILFQLISLTINTFSCFPRKCWKKKTVHVVILCDVWVIFSAESFHAACSNVF